MSAVEPTLLGALASVLSEHVPVPDCLFDEPAWETQIVRVNMADSQVAFVRLDRQPLLDEEPALARATI